MNMSATLSLLIHKHGLLIPHLLTYSFISFLKFLKFFTYRCCTYLLDLQSKTSFFGAIVKSIFVLFQILTARCWQQRSGGFWKLTLFLAAFLHFLIHSGPWALRFVDSLVLSAQKITHMWISTLSPRLANPLYYLCTFLVSLHELEPLASHCAGVLREGICASFPAFRGKHQPLLLITVLRVLFTNILS